MKKLLQKEYNIIKGCCHQLRFLLAFSISLFLLTSVPSYAQVDAKLLSAQTFSRLSRVPEFKFIQEQADLLGVKVYLFGGTASAFAHYVRWDLEREAGDTKYQPERFDYDFTNIYRGNQDLDIVVDGTEAQAYRLRNILHENFPHFIGSKDAWEVRLLRAQIGDKLPLLNDEDFRNQHTDSNSIGMIALNPRGGIVFRDLLDWSNPRSRYLKDISAAKIKYLFNSNHEQTSRYKAGQNPPVLSAVRYLAKLTQYEVQGSPQDLERVTQIIKDTEFSQLSRYAQHKAEEFGLKVLLNSPDSEYAWNLLDQTGLRQKLISASTSNISVEGATAWWMNKEPLRSKPFGETGVTAAEIAKELGLAELIVSHETRSFSAYENITRSARGAANVFISRKNTAGEGAAFGDGFYTRIGMSGAVGTGITIRFKVHPEAREGIDFKRQGGDFLVFQNRSALILVQENMNLSTSDYFKLLLENSISDNDKGLIAKLDRKFRRFLPPPEELKVLAKILLEPGEGVTVPLHLFTTWFSYPGSEDFPKIYNIFLDVAMADRTVLDAIFSQAHFLKKPEVRAKLIKWIRGGTAHQFGQMLKSPALDKYPSILRAFIETYQTMSRDITENIYSKKVVAQKYADEIIDLFHKSNAKVKESFFISIFPQEHWLKLAKIQKLLISYFGARRSLGSHIFENITKVPNLMKYPLIIEALLQNKAAVKPLIINFLSSPEAKIFEKSVVKIQESGTTLHQNLLGLHVFSQPYWQSNPGTRKQFLEIVRTTNNRKALHAIASAENAEKDPELIQALHANPIAENALLMGILRHREGLEYKDILRAIFRSDIKQRRYDVAQYLFSEPHWKNEHELLAEFIGQGDGLTHLSSSLMDMSPNGQNAETIKLMLESKGVSETKNIVSNILSQPGWAAFPELLHIALQNTENINNIITYLLVQKEWQKHFFIIEHIAKNETGQKVGLLISEILTNSIGLLSQNNLLNVLLDRKDPFVDNAIIQYIFPKLDRAKYKALLKSFIENGRRTHFIIDNMDIFEDPDIINLIVKTNNLKDIRHLINKQMGDNPWIIKHPSILKQLLKTQDRPLHDAIIKVILTFDEWNENIPDEILNYIVDERTAAPSKIADLIFNRRPAFKRSETDMVTRETLITPEIIIKLLKLDTPKIHQDVLGYFETQNRVWLVNHPEILDLLIEKNESYSSVLKFLSFSDWSSRLELLTKLLFHTKTDFYAFLGFFQNKEGFQFLKTYPAFIEAVLERAALTQSLYLISNFIMDMNRPDLIKKFLLENIENKDVLSKLIDMIGEPGRHFSRGLMSRYSARVYPELLVLLLQAKQYPKKTADLFEYSDTWKYNPALQSFVQDSPVTYGDLMKALETRDFDTWYKDYVPSPNTCSKILTFN